MDVRPVTPDDAGYVARNLRDADRAEVYAATGEPPEVVIPRSIEVSERVYTILDRLHIPIAIYGIADWTIPGEDKRVGAPWMLGTPGLEREALPFLRECGSLLSHLAEGYDVLCNYVFADNTLHKKWLVYWMGFELDPPVPWGPFGAPFNRFHNGV